MTGQTPNPPGEGDGEPPAAAAPVHRGPPIVIAEEVLDERGERTARLLAQVVGPHAQESGGRDDLPWAVVAPENLLEVARKCRNSSELALDMLHLQFAVDYEDHIQMVYVLFSMSLDRKAILRVNLPAENPTVGSVSGLWEAASWYERETHDLFGVEFAGNPDLSPLLLFDGFEGHPGLKSYPFNDYQEW